MRDRLGVLFLAATVAIASKKESSSRLRLRSKHRAESSIHVAVLGEIDRVDLLASAPGAEDKQIPRE